MFIGHSFSENSYARISKFHKSQQHYSKLYLLGTFELSYMYWKNTLNCKLHYWAEPFVWADGQHGNINCNCSDYCGIWFWVGKIGKASVAVVMGVWIWANFVSIILHFVEYAMYFPKSTTKSWCMEPVYDEIGNSTHSKHHFNF